MSRPLTSDKPEDCNFNAHLFSRAQGLGKRNGLQDIIIIIVVIIMILAITIKMMMILRITIVNISPVFSHVLPL